MKPCPSGQLADTSVDTCSRRQSITLPCRTFTNVSSSALLSSCPCKGRKTKRGAVCITLTHAMNTVIVHVSTHAHTQNAKACSGAQISTQLARITNQLRAIIFYYSCCVWCEWALGDALGVSATSLVTEPKSSTACERERRPRNVWCIW